MKNLPFIYFVYFMISLAPISWAIGKLAKKLKIIHTYYEKGDDLFSENAENMLFGLISIGVFIVFGMICVLIWCMITGRI